jgi:hypothetical protein
MRKIAQKNEVSIMKLSARRGLECRIWHHLSFTTFDYIVAVIQALQFVDYKDVLRFYFFNAI